MYRLRLLCLATATACGVVTGEGVAPPDAPTDTTEEPTPSTGEPGVLYPARRLSPRELVFALEDLLETELDERTLFGDPRRINDLSHMQEVLQVDDLFLDRLVRAVETAVDQAMTSRRWLEESGTTRIYGSEEQDWERGWPVQMRVPRVSTWWVWTDPDPKTYPIDIHVPGTYTLDLMIAAHREASASVTAEVSLNGDVLEVSEVLGSQESPSRWSYTAELDVGVYELAVRFVEGTEEAWPTPPLPVFGYETPTSAVMTDSVVVQGPLGAAGWQDNPVRAHLVRCDDGDVEACSRRTLGALARLAWRRPVEEAELTSLVDLVTETIDLGYGYEDGITVALESMFLAPSFLFRPEVDVGAVDGEGTQLEPFEHASRLSFLLWNTGPDDELFDCAASGDFPASDGPCGLESQLDRMMEDPRFDRFIEDFTESWLGLRRLAKTERSLQSFPDWSFELMGDLQSETFKRVSQWSRGDEPFADVVTAPQSWLNARLARHYGVDGTFDSRMVLTDLSDTDRAGLLTHGSFLTMTSGESRASVVLRGLEVSQRLLCEQHPPPPDDVTMLSEEDEQLEALDAHLTEPACAACHQHIDPYGLPLFAYDGVGKRVAEDLDEPVTLPSGDVASNARDLAASLAANPKLTSCAAENVVLYALGRFPSVDEMSVARELVQQLSQDRSSMRTLLLEALRSEFIVTAEEAP